MLRRQKFINLTIITFCVTKYGPLFGLELFKLCYIDNIYLFCIYTQFFWKYQDKWTIPK